jgi:hypothetical protein
MIRGDAMSGLLGIPQMAVIKPSCMHNAPLILPLYLESMAGALESSGPPPGQRLVRRLHLDPRKERDL